MSEKTKLGLVLEGGGMRATYTIGVLDVMMENNIIYDGIIGVSAGAIHGVSYKSHQPGRNIRYYKKYAHDKRFMSVRNMILTGDMVGKKFCYEDIPWKLDVIDNDTFRTDKTEFYAVCANVETGKTEYFKLDDLKDPAQMEFLRASAKLPFVLRIVNINGYKLLDGGMTDSIPLKKFQDMGYKKNVVVATRTDSYKKEPENIALAKFLYRKYPNFLQSMKDRPQMYNSQKEYILSQEKQKTIFFIRPSEELNISRTDSDPEHLERVYQIGRADAEKNLSQLIKFIGNID